MTFFPNPNLADTLHGFYLNVVFRCDECGGKDTLTMLLAACAIPCMFSGILIQNYASLLVVRSLIGCVGGTLVPVQFWVASHFSPEISGLAMASAGKCYACRQSPFLSIDYGR